VERRLQGRGDIPPDPRAAYGSLPRYQGDPLHGGDNPKQQIEAARHVAALAREKGCDAVIAGNGA
jgi:hypothetical protein